MTWLKFQRSRLAYSGAAVLVSVFIAFLWIYADKISLQHQIELAERNRALQLELASNAMEESFSRLIEENRILANHSFVEYVQGKRSDNSILALLVNELQSYNESLVYAYYDKPGYAKLIQARSNNEEVVFELDTAAKRLWNNFPEFTVPQIIYGEHNKPEPFFMVFFPVYNNSEFTGLLGTAIGLNNAISKYLKPLHSGLERRSMLLFGSGRILWDSENNRGRLFTIKKDVLMTSRSFRISNAEFTIIADEPRAALLADIKSIYYPRIIASVAGFLLLIVSFVTANFLYINRHRRIASQNAEVILNEKIVQKEKELEEKEKRYLTLFETGIDGIIITDLNFVIIECNTAISSLFALPKKDIIGREPLSFAPLTQADGQASSVYLDNIHDKIKRGLLFDFEILLKKEQREIFVASIRVTKTVFGSETVYQAIIRDITKSKNHENQLKSALEDREILLRELHHRVKNNYQFLDSLLSLQKGMEPEEVQVALSKVQARIAAVSAAYLATADNHESLKVDAKNYLSVLVSRAYDLNDTASHHEAIIDSDDIPLSLDTAAIFGLLFHELVDNAFSHAYRDNPEGVLDISFKHQDNYAVLTVRDYGKGLPPNIKDGLGLTIARALCLQLHGTFRLETENPGSIARAIFPLS